ncbi:MAG: Gfo/Idh/MocA family oxidoreductase [Anaerolineales bacterium]|nr:Gfo/Idh/MocA family oxidoreductase [Anaerolineales bacterium]
MKQLRTGIIGCGHFARKHAAHLSAIEEVNLVGFCDKDAERAISYNEQFTQRKGSIFTDYQELFSDMDLDLVYICLPPFAHGNEVELACQHGVNILIEKPIALDMEQANSMAKHVHASGVKCQVGFMYRFGKAALEFRRYLQESSSEPKGFMLGRYACNSLHSNWWRSREHSGGQLVEQVIHLLDMSRYFFGEPIKVFSLQDNLFHRDVESYTNEDVSATVIQFASGSVATIAATNGAIPNRWEYDWRLVTKEVTADFSDSNNATFYQTAQEGVPTSVISGKDDLYLAETMDLLEAIRENRETFVPIDEGVRSLNLALSATLSAQKETPINISLP